MPIFAYYGVNRSVTKMLSDGEKCTLALFGDLVKRLALANPGLDNPLEGEGVVLIDEIELHLHRKSYITNKASKGSE